MVLTQAVSRVACAALAAAGVLAAGLVVRRVSSCCRARRASSAQPGPVLLQGGKVFLPDGHWHRLDVLVSDQRVAALLPPGTTDAALAEASQPLAQARRVDAIGALVLPGLRDAHVHLSLVTASRLAVSLADHGSLDDVYAEMARAAAARNMSQAILWGHTWAPPPAQRLDDPMLRVRQSLDAILSDVPVIVFTKDIHTALLNTCALQRLGWFDHQPEALVDFITLDASGVPTGVVTEQAAFQAFSMTDVAPRTSPAVLSQVQRELHSVGITHLMSIEDAQGVQQLAEAGLTGLHVDYFLRTGDLELIEKGALIPISTTHLVFRGIKLFSDGSMGSRTAWMHHEYSDRPGHFGHSLLTDDELTDLVHRTHQLGLPVAVHAIGDRANTHVVRVLTKFSMDGLPDRIEHFQLVDDETIESLSQCPNIIAGMQPCHLIHDDLSVVRIWGTDRQQHGFRVKSAMQRVAVEFGCDAPVEPLLPMRNLVACDRIWNKNERPTRHQALAASTHTGNLRVTAGMPANLAVLPESVLNDVGDALIATRAIATLVDGALVHHRADSPSS